MRDGHDRESDPFFWKRAKSLYFWNQHGSRLYCSFKWVFDHIQIKKFLLQLTMKFKKIESRQSGSFFFHRAPKNATLVTDIKVSFFRSLNIDVIVFLILGFSILK